MLVWKLGPGQAWERRGKSPVSLPSSRGLPHGFQQQDRFAPSAPKAWGTGPFRAVALSSTAAGRTWVNIFIK